jgi:hypothetical protein
MNFFYKKEIFAEVSKNLISIADTNADFTEREETFLESTARGFSHMVEYVHEEDFAEVFKGCNNVFVPCRKPVFSDLEHRGGSGLSHNSRIIQQ